MDLKPDSEQTGTKRIRSFRAMMMKTPIFLLLTLALLDSHTAQASWLIDTRQFHISAHGQISCQDCHENIKDLPLHPNPGDVNKKLTDFFKAEQCLACHDNVLDNLEQGRHGAKDVEDREKFLACLDCHNPHYQLRLGKNKIGRFVPGKPRYEQCGACHEPRSSLPPFDPEDKACMTCHRLTNPDELQGREQITRLCFYCHARTGSPAQDMTGRTMALIDTDQYDSTSHVETACTVCHPQSARFQHGSQRVGDCLQCHVRHPEKVTHALHAGVTCEACHLQGIEPFRDPQSKRVVWKIIRRPEQSSRVHHMVLGREETSCKRCHFPGNEVGAAAMILPAKSILCMPCHSATFSVGDTTTVLSLIVFFIGAVLVFSYWFSGSLPGRGEAGPLEKPFRVFGPAFKGIFSRKMVAIAKTILLDVLLQRRLYRHSRTRWIIHSLIFLPFLFRFSWGLVALIGSLWQPHWGWVWPMLDTDSPATAFLFDLTGMMLILGVFLAFVRGTVRQAERLPGAPGGDFFALGLIAAVVVIGFVLEGMRIAMTGRPMGSGYAFLGYAISRLFSYPTGAVEVYGYLWYIHAILTGIFIAYLPFSRLFHLIMAPIVLAMNATSGHDHDK
jgi:nitrate reductase gamma subunit